jgi:hypothetical protein
MATLGNTNAAGAAFLNNWGGYTEVSGPYTAIASGAINDVQLYVSGGTVTDQVMRGVVYEGSNGATAVLVATGAEVTVLALDNPAWVVSAVSSGSIVAGNDYWIGRETGPTNPGSRIFFYAGSSGDARYVTNSYPTAPADLTGSSAYTDQMCAYLDYTPAGAPPANSTPPGVSGFAKVGSVLSCSTGTWVDDGSPTYTYQWWQGSNASPIGGATSSTYTSQAGDIGLAIGCTVTDTDSNGATAADSYNTVAVSAAAGSGFFGLM